MRLLARFFLYLLLGVSVLALSGCLGKVPERPVIKEIVIDPEPVPPGATARVTVEASSATKDLLSYHYSAARGSIRGIGRVVDYTAPSDGTTDAITVRVYDGKGETVATRMVGVGGQEGGGDDFDRNATSDGSMFRIDLARTGYSGSESLDFPLEVKWSAPTDGYSRTSPTIAGRVIYVGTNEYSLVAYDLDTGNLLWSFLTRNMIESSPAVADGVVFFGSADHFVYAVNAADGTLRWKQQTGNQVLASPVVYGGGVYVTSSDGNAYAFDGGTGALKWRTFTGGVSYTSPALVAEAGILVTSSDHYLMGLDIATGQVRWQTGAQGGISGPAVLDGIVYAASGGVGMGSPEFLALDALTGRILWRLSVSGTVFGSPAVADGRVFFPTSNGVIYGVEAKTGGVLWMVDINADRDPGTPVVMIYGSPTVSGNNVYIGTDDGRLLVLDTVSGKVVWQFDVESVEYTGAINGAPVIRDGVLYFTAGDHRLYALW